MKPGGIVLSLAVVFLTEAASFGVPETLILYDVTDLGSQRWQCTYDVVNISLPEPVGAFTIWFDFDLYDNLTVTTLDPPAAEWHEVFWQPNVVLQQDGGYYASALTSGVGIGQTVGGFTINFDWLGSGEPGSQFYEIIDPHTFETIDSGLTVPEPITIAWFGFGLLILRQRRESFL